MKPAQLYTLLKVSVQEWVNDRAGEHAGAISFYMLFAMAPIIIIIVAVAGTVLGDQAARGELVHRMEGTVGTAGAEVVETIIANAAQPGGGVLGTTIGVVLLIVGATGVLAQLKASLNYIWDVEAKPGRTIRSLILTRLWSLLLVLLLALVLMASLLASSVLAGVYERVEQSMAMPAWVAETINFLVMLVIMTLLIAVVYKVLPDVRIKWRDVWVGALITSLLFNIGRILIGIYLGRAGVGSAYGAAGSLVAVLIWLYYSACIFLYGAELTQVYAAMFGKGIRPNAYAVRPEGPRKPTLRPELAA